MANTLTKGDIAKILADKLDVTQTKASNILNTVIETLEAELVAGNSINLTGFAKMEVVTRAAHTARNPGNGETVNVPEKKVPVFRAGMSLKKAVK